MAESRFRFDPEHGSADIPVAYALELYQSLAIFIVYLLMLKVIARGSIYRIGAHHQMFFDSLVILLAMRYRTHRRVVSIFSMVDRWKNGRVTDGHLKRKMRDIASVVHISRGRRLSLCVQTT